MTQDNENLKKNRQDLAKVYKKYFISRKKSFFAKKIEKLKYKIILPLFGNKKILINKKSYLTHKNFLSVFDQESYLLANIDVIENIEKNELDRALEHFILFGSDEVRSGKRRIGIEFPFMSEAEYVKANADVKASTEKGDFPSAFEHFILFGYREFLAKKRELPGNYVFTWTESLKNSVKLYFNETAYLEANEDIKSAIDKGQFKNAWEHFVLLGAEEIRRGERTLHPFIPQQSDKQYTFLNNDIFDREKYNHVTSPFEHFLLYGAEEIISGERKVVFSKVYKYKIPKLTADIESELEAFSLTPLISVIMPVYNVDAKWLRLAIASLNAQWYSNWELCIADDASTKKETIEFLTSIKNPKIKISYLKDNVNISAASNAALELASGEYIALMDNDDELTVDAFYEVVKSINRNHADFIYSDEDKLELDGTFTDPHFKPDFAPDMFLSQNYLSHLGVIKKSLVEEVDGWSVGLEGAQDYDLYLRVLELTDKVVHIPKVLYHWRKIPGSTAAEFSDKSYAQDAGKTALENAMKRRDINAKILNGKYPGTYRVKYDIKGSPLVSIVIPFKDKPELLDMCINSIIDKSTYENYEIIGISNNSEETKTFESMEKLKAKDKRVSFYEYNVPFNYSDINNHAVNTYAKGEHIVLLNNDIEIITAEWIESMLEFSQQENIGTVGAKLYYSDDTIQHAGVILGIGGVAGHSHKYFNKIEKGYFSRLHIIQNLSAVTAACLMVKKNIFIELNGLNENNLKIAFNDVDFCLRIREKGYLNIFTPYCEAYHYESISRGKEDSIEKQERFKYEVEYMMKRHKKILNISDPYYNRNLTLEFENFEYK